MKKLLTIITFLFCFNANAFLYEEEDKNLHLATSMALSYTITSTIMLTNDKISSKDAALIALGATIILGLAKETLIDDHFDNDDMIANTIGAGVGTIPFILIDF